MGCCPHVAPLVGGVYAFGSPGTHRRRMRYGRRLTRNLEANERRMPRACERELKAMKRWYLPSIAPSSEKARRARAGSRRAARAVGRSSESACPVLVARVPARSARPSQRRADGRSSRPRARGRGGDFRQGLDRSCRAETVECEAGTLVTFDPGERHALRGLDDARLLLTLAPWPAAGHNAASEAPHDQHLPVNATVEPIDDSALTSAASEIQRRTLPDELVQLVWAITVINAWNRIAITTRMLPAP